ncbi:teichuronic acid biosynthesis protein TuaB [Peribacillus sp. SCS-37]|uniref:teichuronic acid biosynthesis protein TuaB n=1 Tax=Paraperibacillus esterisolvens TaxID=3115296 RepID=UPI003905BED5
MGTMRGDLAGGSRWTAISTAIITAVQIIQFLFLGNLLSPAEFGAVGIVTAILIFAQIILDLGAGSAIIQLKEVTQELLSSLFWLNVFCGFLICITLFLSSSFAGIFFKQEELTGLLKILSLLFLAAPFGQQSQYLLQRNLEFKKLGQIEAGAAVISFLMLLILTAGIEPLYAFVISQTVLYSIRGFLYFALSYKTWHPAFIFRLNECRTIFRFAGFQLLSRLVNRAASNMDVFLIGRFMGAEALGIYNLVYQIITIPVLKFNPILTRVAFPVFSKNQDSPTALKEGYLLITKILALAAFPMLSGLAAVSSPFILTVFGEEWLDAVPILQIMTIVGTLRVLMNPSGAILLAKGRAELAFYWDAGMLLLYGSTIFAAVQSGSLEAVAWTYTGVSLVNFILGRYLLSKLIGLKWGGYLYALKKPALLSLFISAAAVGARNISAGYFSAGILPSLAISILSAAALYLVLLAAAYPHHVRKFIKNGRSL